MLLGRSRSTRLSAKPLGAKPKYLTKMKNIRNKGLQRKPGIRETITGFLLACLNTIRLFILLFIGAGAGIVITNNAIGKINDNPDNRIAIGKSLIIIIIMSMFSIALLLKKKAVKFFYKHPKHLLLLRNYLLDGDILLQYIHIYINM